MITDLGDGNCAVAVYYDESRSAHRSGKSLASALWTVSNSWLASLKADPSGPASRVVGINADASGVIEIRAVSPADDALAAEDALMNLLHGHPCARCRPACKECGR